MMFDRMVKRLFPRSSRWERRNKINSIIIVLIVGFVVAIFVAVALILKNPVGK
jgi:uncharacterized membrane protein